MVADLDERQIVFLRISLSIGIWVYLKLKLDKKTNKKIKILWNRNFDFWALQTQGGIYTLDFTVVVMHRAIQSDWTCNAYHGVVFFKPEESLWHLFQPSV